jgi:Amt family ammonium transporter
VADTGNIAGRAAVNTSLSAATGACTALFVNLWIQERKTGEYKFDLSKALNGTLSALVAITAPCGTVENWAALLIGAVAGLLYLAGSHFLVSIRLDDAVDAIPVHMINGMWGLIATGLLSSPKPTLEAFGTDEHVGWFYSLGRGSFDATLLGNQVMAVGFILGWVAVNMTPFFMGLNYMGWFRADSLEELVGLDLSYVGIRQEVVDEDFNDDYSDGGSNGAGVSVTGDDDSHSVAKGSEERAKSVGFELTPRA